VVVEVGEPVALVGVVLGQEGLEDLVDGLLESLLLLIEVEDLGGLLLCEGGEAGAQAIAEILILGVGGVVAPG